MVALPDGCDFPMATKEVYNTAEPTVSGAIRTVTGETRVRTRTRTHTHPDHSETTKSDN